MPDQFASRADLDALRQQLQSDPSTAFPAFRCVPMVVQRDYSGVAIPAGNYDEWDRLWTFRGSGGLLYPDREIAARLLLAFSNFSGHDLACRYLFTLNGTVIVTGFLPVLDGQDRDIRVSFGLLAAGSNNSQILFPTTSVTITGLSEITPLAIDLAVPWDLTMDVSWADYDINFPAVVGTQLSFPAIDTYATRHHSLVVLT